MRIVVLGDFHLNELEFEITEMAMQDVADSSPDLVVPLGDFGTQELIGSTEGLHQSYQFLSQIRAPIRPLLGNHDLQRESGDGVQEQRTMEQELVRLYHLQAPYGVLEYEQFRLFFISTDPQPADSCYQVQECYVSEEQFQWLVKTLEQRPGIPAIIFSHAPPVGCGLRTVPQTHVRATNAYLDQNHDPYRWFQLIKNYPEIVMWFSAHYHLSHVYPDSHTSRYGTEFFTTGVHGTATRDGKRQSRVIDISSNRITVSTLDHDQRTLCETADWSYDGSLSMMVRDKENLIKPANIEEDSINPFRCLTSFSIGEGKILAGGMLSLDRERCLAATEDGFLWEIHHAYEAVMGTLLHGIPLVGVALSEDGIWSGGEHKLVRTDPHSIWRFQRDTHKKGRRDEIELPCWLHCLAPRNGGGVWVGCENSLVEAIFPQGEAEYSNPFRTVFAFRDRIVRMIPDSRGIWVLTEVEQVYYYDITKEHAELMFEGVRDWDVYQGEFTGIIRENNHYLICQGKDKSWRLPVPLQIEALQENVQIVCLEGGHSLLSIAGKAYFAENGAIVHEINTGDRKVTALARTCTTNPIQFCLGLDSASEHQRPQLQIWQYESVRE